MKKDMEVHDLCEGLPSFFHWYMHYVKSLIFDELPKYELINEKIKECLDDELKCLNDNEFDWAALSTA